jgi:hypothetical protein
MSRIDDGRLKVVQIAVCGPFGDGSHMLYALTEDGRVWCQWSGTWLEEPPIEDKPSDWQLPRKAAER